MTRKKILYVITKANMGGAQRYVFDLASSLPKNTYEVSVALGAPGLLKTKLEEVGIKTYVVQNFIRDIDLMKELRSFRELFTLMRKVRPDIVHLNSSKAGGTGALVARLCGVKRILFTAHGWPFYERRSLITRVLIWFFSYVTTLLVDEVIVVSEHDKLHAHMPGLSHKLTKIHTSLPPIPFESREDARAAIFSPEIIEAHANDVWLVSTGELTRNKNISALIEAFALIPRETRKKIFLSIIGEGELRSHLESLVTLHELRDQVHFTGFVPEARLFLSAFDVFVIPSLKEGFPYGLLEAGAAGLASVASNVGGIPEIILDEKTGLLIDPNDIKGMSEKLVRLANDEKLRKELGAELKGRVESAYSLPRMLEATRALYEPKGSETA